MNLCELGEFRELLSRYGFRFSKQMGQNFLIADWVPKQTAEASGAAPGVGVLEIGPGIGPLTAELSDRAEKVLAIELDRSLLPVLEETLAGRENVEIISGDVLKLNLRELCQEKFSGIPVVVCANLPYNITTPVITAVLEAGCFSSVTVMIQKEVAERICAQPGTGEYGAFTVFCQYFAHCALLYEVPAQCFYPEPKVTSAVIRMELYRNPPVSVPDPGLFFRVVRASFAQRRKTLLNGLFAAFGQNLTKQDLGQVIQDCGLPEGIRGERLDLGQFAEITKKIGEKQGSFPPHLA